MRYNVTHLTEYYYGTPVPLCHNMTHLKPRQTDRQSLISHDIAVTPNPIVRSERIDFFGNRTTRFSVQEPHDALKICARSTVDVKRFEPPTAFWWPGWEDVTRMLQGGYEGDLLDARQFVYDSPDIATGPELAAYAQPTFKPGRSLLECMTELTDRIHDEFTFDTDVTTIGTPILEVLEHRHGVCQDFAHLQIGCLRSLGLAARYVSGYLSTKPPPGQPRLVGGDATHAWVSVFFPDFGWIDFDPTNGMIPSDGHISLAWARDYSDISPVRGVVIGGHHHGLYVSVDVEPVDAKDGRDAKAKV